MIAWKTPLPGQKNPTEYCALPVREFALANRAMVLKAVFVTAITAVKTLLYI
jgi:hypothetical protein